MSNLIKILFVLAITILLSSSFTLVVIADSNSNSNVNGGTGIVGNTPQTPSTVIKNWHEIK